jgi:HSP90 family molecular chaperone
MLRITVLTKHSVFFVFLLSNTVNPLLASSNLPTSIVQEKLQNSSLYKDIANLLVEKGLDETIAANKVKKLFKNNSSSKKLSLLYNNTELFASKEKLNETFANYALYGKTFSTDSYASLVGLAQYVSSKPLNKEQLDTISYIASHS